MTDASTPNGGHYPDDPALNAAVSKPVSRGELQ